MSQSENSPNADFAEESNKLSEGLKTCRSVVENYRLMIGGHTEQSEHPDALNDNQ